MRWVARLAIVLPGAVCVASKEETPVNYMLTAEISMPHLEENLRYAIKRETHCLTRPQLLTFFPILRHPSLSGCTLRLDSETGDAIIYDLACQPDHGTTGQARWEAGPQMRGTLRIRLGGKNMTFSQRVTAVPLGACRL